MWVPQRYFYMWVWWEARRGTKIAVVSHLMWVLVTELDSLEEQKLLLIVELSLQLMFKFSLLKQTMNWNYGNLWLYKRRTDEIIHLKPLIWNEESGAGPGTVPVFLSFGRLVPRPHQYKWDASGPQYHTHTLLYTLNHFQITLWCLMYELLGALGRQLLCCILYGLMTKATTQVQCRQIS